MLRKVDILDSIRSGFLSASENYQNWSGNRTIHDAGIEFLATARIAEHLITRARADCPDSWVYLEMPFKLIKEQSGVDKHKPGQKPDILSENSRVDIAYFDRTGHVRGIIELKRHLSYSSLKKDFDRICALLDYYGRPYGKLKFGAVAAVRPVTGEQQKGLDQVAKDIVEKFKEDHMRPIDSLVREEKFRNADNVPYESAEDTDNNGFVLANGVGIACFYIGTSRSD